MEAMYALKSLNSSREGRSVGASMVGWASTQVGVGIGSRFKQFFWPRQAQDGWIRCTRAHSGLKLS